MFFQRCVRGETVIAGPVIATASCPRSASADQGSAGNQREVLRCVNVSARQYESTLPVE